MKRSSTIAILIAVALHPLNGFAYSYNQLGQMLSMSYPSGRTVSMHYDSAGRADCLWPAAGASCPAAGQPVYARDFSYAPHGAVQQMTLGNGLVEATTFNRRLQPTQIQAGSLMTLGFTYGASGNNNGNIQTQTINRGGTVWSQSFTYDNVNRLKTAGETGNWTQGYGYDAAGNRWVDTANSSGFGVPTTLETPIGTTTSTWFSGGKNQFTNWGYDAAGNVTQVDGMTRSFTYDAENRQLTATVTGGTSTYSYDGEGHRVKAVTVGANAGTTVFVYDASGQLAVEFGPDADTGTKYLTSDHLGSTRLITTSTGAADKCYDYLPFGETIPSSVGRSAACFSATTDNTRNFSGKERDAESNLDYFLARYYSGAQGRFTSPDEWAGGIVDAYSGGQVGTPGPLPYGDINDPQTLNKYTYVRNNPLRYVDPDGHFFDILADAAFIAYDIHQLVKEGATTTNVLSLGADVVGAAVPFVTGLGAAVRVGHAAEVAVHGAEAAAKGAEGATHLAGAGKAAESGAAGGADKLLYRRGPNDSKALLETQSKAAEKAGLPHGVSVSSNPAAKAGQVVRCATCSSVEAAGFKVHKTGGKNHYTVELPKPITKGIAEKFNELFN